MPRYLNFLSLSSLRRPFSRRGLLIFAGGVVCVYALAVLFYVQSVPDLGLKSVFSTEIKSAPNLFRVDERFHEREHAVEVELPLIQAAWPDASVLPIEVPAIDSAAAIGIATAKQLEQAGVNAVFLASSDMTHYGPSYRFTPAGIGLGALGWALSNDERLLQLVTDMTVDRIVPEVRSRFNACGGGAIAAMMAACLERGASGGAVLRHANSYETLAHVARQGPENAVGYAAVVIG